MQQNLQTLSRISDWESKAELAQYQSSSLAQNCGVSAKSLERFFKMHMGIPPQTWLDQLRSIQAAELIRRGISRKQIASTIGIFRTLPLNRKRRQVYNTFDSRFPGSR